MASIKYTALVNEIKGKIAGTVFQGGYAGTIVKTKSNYGVTRGDGKLTKADAGKVINVQANLAQLATNWKDLTNSNRLSWTSAAVNYPFKNRFGETYIGSGFQVYMQLNLNLLAIGESSLSAAPTPVVLPITPNYHFNLAALPAMELVLDSSYPADSNLILECSSPISPTVQYIKNKFAAIKILISTDTFPIEVQDDYTAVKGTIPTGCFLNTRLTAVSNISGQKGLSILSSIQF